MITMERVKIISKLTLPISVALGSTLTMALVDLAMVGRFGNHATAALGLSVFSNTLVLAFVSGIAPAVQGIVARRRGQGAAEAKCLPLNAGLLMALLVGTPLTVIGYWLSPLFFPVISHDPEVIKIGVPFLQILYLAVIAVGMDAAFRGFWTGMEKVKLYMTIVLFMQCMNGFLNYTLIFGHFGAPALGPRGAAIATASSLYAGVIVNFAMIYFRFRKDAFLKARPEASLLARIFKLGLPGTVQEFLFAAGYIVFFMLVGRMGTAELAAANVLTRFSLVAGLLAMSIGIASATLVSRTVGEGDLAGAARWGWDSGKLGIILITLLGVPLFLFPRLFLSIFLTNPATILMAVVPLRIMAAGTGVASLIYIFAYTLISVGDGNRVILVSFATQ